MKKIFVISLLVMIFLVIGCATVAESPDSPMPTPESVFVSMTPTMAPIDREAALVAQQYVTCAEIASDFQKLKKDAGYSYPDTDRSNLEQICNSMLGTYVENSGWPRSQCIEGQSAPAYDIAQKIIQQAEDEEIGAITKTGETDFLNIILGQIVEGREALDVLGANAH